MITGLLKLRWRTIFSNKYGGISYSNLDYKIDDGTTYWRYEDATYQEHK